MNARPIPSWIIAGAIVVGTIAGLTAQWWDPFARVIAP